MALTHLTREQHDLVCLVLENQPLSRDELLQMCGVRLGLSYNQAWDAFSTLLVQQILTTSEDGVTVREDSEVLQELALEQAMERAEERAGQLKDSRKQDAAPEAHTQPPQEGHSDGTQGPQAGPGTGSAPTGGGQGGQGVAAPAAGTKQGAAAPEAKAKAKGKRPGPKAKAKGKRPRPKAKGKRPGLRRILPLAVCAAALAVVLAIVLAVVLRPPTYPMTVRSGGRELTILSAPENKAQSAAEKWIIKYVKGRTDAEPHFQTLNVSNMRDCELSQRWDEDVGAGGDGAFDPACNFQGTVVFADALAAGGAEPESGAAYQYRLYLEGDEEDGYSVYACRSCPAAWMEPYDAESFEAGGESYTLSLCGEGTEYGHCMRMAVLESGGQRQILYLSETAGANYGQQARIVDLNGDGELDIVIDAQDSRQMCYLFDQNEGGYRFFAPLSGGQIVSSAALPGTVLLTQLDGEDVWAVFYRWDDGARLTELARMESTGIGTGGRVCEYYAGGRPVRQYTQDGAVMPGDLDQNQQTLFNQYMAYVYWDELVLETAREQGCLALPEEAAPAGEWETLTLLEGFPQGELSLYVSPSGLLLVRQGEKLQVIPCSFAGQQPMPTVADLDGDGQLDILLPFNDITPALLLARWTGEEWGLTGCSLGEVQADFKSCASLSWTRRGMRVNYEGAYGSSSAYWARAELPEDETGTLALDMKDYTLSVRGGVVSIAFPVRIEREDGSIVESGLAYTVDLRVPTEGVPEMASGRLTSQ